MAFFCGPAIEKGDVLVVNQWAKGEGGAPPQRRLSELFYDGRLHPHPGLENQKITSNGQA
jgi:hypothetical protein